jgi:HK97 family phage major capsid protein
MLFGDMRQYKVRMVRGIEWKILTERYAETRQNGYFAFNRWDGELIDTNAVKKLVLAAS